jgi:hypothetical protein
VRVSTGARVGVQVPVRARRPARVSVRTLLAVVGSDGMRAS